MIGTTMTTPARRAERAGLSLGVWKASLTHLRTVVLGLTMRDFARRLGVHWTTVRSWEECGSFPTERLLDRLYDFAHREAAWGTDNWRSDHMGELHPWPDNEDEVMQMHVKAIMRALAELLALARGAHDDRK